MGALIEILNSRCFDLLGYDSEEVRNWERRGSNKRSGVRIPSSAFTVYEGSAVSPRPEKLTKKIRLLNQGLAAVRRCMLRPFLREEYDLNLCQTDGSAPAHCARGHRFDSASN